MLVCGKGLVLGFVVVVFGDIFLILVSSRLVVWDFGGFLVEGSEFILGRF